jgi:ubiquinone/menaquinone biosynthesis C-methylase UbiE
VKYVAAFDENEIDENHRAFTERIALHKKEGMDFFGSFSSILQKAGSFKTPLLEIGTGRGYTALVLARAGYCFTSVDRNEEMTRTAAMNLAYEGLLSKADLRIMDASALDLPNSAFNSIIAVNFFHHVADPHTVLSEMDRVLNAGGKMLVVDFSGSGMKKIDQVHHKEGRVHEDTGAGKESVLASLRGLGYNTRELDEKYYWVLEAVKKEAD